MWRLLISLLSLMPWLAAGQVYKWVDSAGEVHYSDRPAAGATALDVPVKKVPPPRPERPGLDQASPGPYAQFDILIPEPNATVRDAEGSVQVGLILDPPLMEGHHLQLIADGTPVAGDISGTQLRISAMGFGTHQLQAKILDADGRLIASSAIIQFHLRKPDSP